VQYISSNKYQIKKVHKKHDGENRRSKARVISSDCKQVISDIDKSSKSRFGAIISEIKLRASNLNCFFIFESRAVNGEAHRLAKYSLTLGQGHHVLVWCSS
jgi:hypothetical protein